MKTDSLNPWKVVCWMVLGGTLILGAAIAVDQMRTSPTQPVKKSNSAPVPDVKPAVDVIPLKMALFSCKHDLGTILGDLKLLQMTERVMENTSRSLEGETAAGKVVLLQRELAKSDSQIVDLKSTAAADVDKLREAIRTGRAFISTNRVDPSMVDEFESWAKHCEAAILTLQQWKRDLMVAASKDNLENTKARISGDYVNALNRTEYDAVMNRNFDDLLAGPQGYRAP